MDSGGDFLTLHGEFPARASGRPCRANAWKAVPGPGPGAPSSFVASTPPRESQPAAPRVGLSAFPGLSQIWPRVVEGGRGGTGLKTSLRLADSLVLVVNVWVPWSRLDGGQRRKEIASKNDQILLASSGPSPRLPKALAGLDRVRMWRSQGASSQPELPAPAFVQWSFVSSDMSQLFALSPFLQQRGEPGLPNAGLEDFWERGVWDSTLGLETLVATTYPSKLFVDIIDGKEQSPPAFRWSPPGI
ncbi:hypothetical protein P7K49_031386 [Saguinus oedipus]|uniref:Uncharacterized protein n=1 Tax=Saguinus oedipus TaxID=9490 RepID=A0ABQ9U067_SAGOE|nr:hypothetical protein P7K49_031386 [Saguinus oedipus]